MVALRDSDAFVPKLSLVAETEGEIIGQIMFSEAKVGDDMVRAFVYSSQDQKQGVGAALIKEGHRIAKKLDYQYSLVLGIETYYPRTGYLHAEQFGIEVPEGIPNINFMAIKLQENAKPIYGAVKYAKAFCI